MAREFAKGFYQSKAWKDCRASYIASVYGLCERCEAKGIFKHGNIVHHKVYLNAKNISDPNITLNHEHLLYVCLECHNTIHYAKHKATREGLVFNESGEIIKKD